MFFLLRSQKMKTPYPHQDRAVTQVRDQLRLGKKRVILTLPTGSGKTFVAGMIFQMAREKGKTCMFLAHRRELIFQASETFKKDFELPTGVILAGEQPTPSAPIQVASKSTLAARAVRRNSLVIPPVDLLIVDECHLSMAKEYRETMELVSQDGYALGLTATPARKSGKALGEWWDGLVIPVQYRELIDAKLLVGTEAYAPHIPDMRGVREKDWEIEGGTRLDTAKLVGDIYTHWLSLAGEQATIGFASNVKHSVHLTRLFRSKGVEADHVDGKTPKDERERIFGDLANGRLQVVWNCDVASEGIDIPRVSAVILAAPTKSIVKYRQRAGRSMRTYPGKKVCTLIDHSGVTLQFGLPDEDIRWKLQAKGRVEKDLEKNPQEKEQRICPECFALFYGNTCPACGYARPRRAREIAVRKGLLRKVKRDRPGIINGKQDIRKAWVSCLMMARGKHGNMSMASAIFHTHTGLWPNEVKSVALPHPPRFKDKRLVEEVIPTRSKTHVYE